MILEGRDFNRSLSTSLHKISTNIAQLIRFNSVKKKRSEKIQNFRHSTKNESPLLVLVGLKFHAKPGKDGLVDSKASERLSITNNRVVIIRRSMCQVSAEYHESWIVCPSQLQDHVFTTAVIDHLDHYLASTTAQSSFYGATISILQHASVPISSPLFWLNTTKTDRCTKLWLLESFTEIRLKLKQKPHHIPV